MMAVITSYSIHYTKLYDLLLDEPTSALDAGSESVLISNLEKLKEKMTIILIIHNLDRIKNADQIILMSNGKSHKISSYEELLLSPEYKALKLNQTNSN